MTVGLGIESLYSQYIAQGYDQITQTTVRGLVVRAGLIIG